MPTQDERFDRLDASVERIDAAIVRMDASIERIDASIVRMDASIERMAVLIERLSQRTDERFDNLTKYILDFREEVSNRLRTIESRLDLQSVTLTSMDARESRIPALTKAVLDAGSFSSQLAMELSKQRDSAFILAVRLEKLEDSVAQLLKPAA